MSRLIVSYFVALICASACQAELSLLGTKSSIQIWTPIDCDDPILMRPVPPDSAPNATSSASSLTSSDCAWKRLQFDYRLLIVNQTQSNDIGSVPTINLISGELVATMDSALAGARLEFHVMTTESGQLSTLVPPGAPLQITSGSKSNLNYSFAALEVRQLNMQVLPSGVRVSLSSINSSSSRHANEPAEWIHIQILNGTWRLSRRLRIGQSLTFVRPVTSSQSTPAYSLCLSHLALSDRPVRLSVNNVLRPWNEQQVRPFRIQVQGQVTDGCSRSLVACRPPCLHGAHCHTDLYGLGHCGCESVGYSGHNCYFPLYRRDCDELYMIGFRTNGMYWIDLDGPGPLTPTRVYCDFAPDHSVTIVHHNLRNETIVRSDAHDAFYLQLKYFDFDLVKLQRYRLMFDRCEQTVIYDCLKSPFGLGDHAWFRLVGNRSRNVYLLGDDFDWPQYQSNRYNCRHLDRWTQEYGRFRKDVVWQVYFQPFHAMDNFTQPDPTARLLSRWLNRNQLKSITHRPNESILQKPQARLTISPLKCSQSKHLNQTISFSSSNSWLTWKPINQDSLWPDGHAEISFAFRTLTANSSSLLRLELFKSDKSKQFDQQPYLEINLVDDCRISFVYPHLENIQTKHIETKSKWTDGEWHLIQFMAFQSQFRLSVDTKSSLITFDSLKLLNTSTSKVYIGGHPNASGLLGCLKGLHFGPTQVVDLTNKVKALTNRNRPIDSNQVFIGCDRHCERSPCVGESICIEHWAYRRCWCRNPIAQLGFNCELNLNSNAVTMISEQPHIHFTLPRHFGAFRRNHLREFDHERVRVLELLRMFNVRDVYESEGAAAEMVVTTTESSLERFVNRSLWTMMDDNVINKEIINSIDQPEMTRSFNSTMATTPKISSLPSRLIRAPESLGPLRMMVQLAIRSRVSDGLLLYANDNCNNFVQFHLVDASRICATINVGQHLIRAEIHVPSNLFKNGSLIQIRLRRYDQVSVFTVAHATSAGKWIQRVLVLIIPLQFLDSYSHRPFRTSAKFSAVAILEIKQIEQVIDLRADLIDSSFDSSNRTRIGAAEQVIPLRRHMKVQMSEEALLNGDAQQELQIAWPQSIVCNDSNDCDSTEHERVYLQHLNSLAKGRNVTLQTLADMLQLPSIVSSTFNVTVGALSDTTPNVTKTNGNVTQVFLGNVDGQNILSTLPGFRGCVSGLVINNKNVNLTKIVELRNKDEVQAGHFLLDCRMLCDIANCQNNGKCIDDWNRNTTQCACDHTSFIGHSCEIDLGSSFDGNSFVAYRLEPNRALLSGQVQLEFAFSHFTIEPVSSIDRYQAPVHLQWPQSPTDLHVLLLLVYEVRYLLVAIDSQFNLYVSDADEQGNEYQIVIPRSIDLSGLPTWFDHSRHYFRYERSSRTVFLDDRSWSVVRLNNSVKHFYLPNPSDYGIYVAGKPRKDRRFTKHRQFNGCISNVKMMLADGQMFQPFDAAFNGVNISHVRVKGRIRQTVCGSFRSNRLDSSSYRQLRSKENVFDVWMQQPEAIRVPISIVSTHKPPSMLTYRVSWLFGSLGFLILILLPVAVYMCYLQSRHVLQKLEVDTPFFRYKSRRQTKIAKSIDLNSNRELRLLLENKQRLRQMPFVFSESYVIDGSYSTNCRKDESIDVNQSLKAASDMKINHLGSLKEESEEDLLADHEEHQNSLSSRVRFVNSIDSNSTSHDDSEGDDDVFV